MAQPTGGGNRGSKSTSANRTLGVLRQRAPYELRVMTVSPCRATISSRMGRPSAPLYGTLRSRRARCSPERMRWSASAARASALAWASAGLASDQPNRRTVTERPPWRA
jgi:hypothetical protein